MNINFGNWATAKVVEGIVAPGYKTDFRGGIVAGTEGRFEINKRFGLAVNLLFNQKGWNGEWEWNTVKTEEQIKLNYIDISITPFVNVSHFYVMAGPVLGYGLGGKYSQVQSQGGRFIIEYKHDVVFGTPGSTSQGFYIDNKVDFAGLIGAGVLINRVYIDVRYQKSFTNMFDEGTSKNISLQLTAGYMVKKW